MFDWRQQERILRARTMCKAMIAKDGYARNGPFWSKKPRAALSADVGPQRHCALLQQTVRTGAPTTGLRRWGGRPAFHYCVTGFGGSGFVLFKCRPLAAPAVASAAAVGPGPSAGNAGPFLMCRSPLFALRQCARRPNRSSRSPSCPGRCSPSAVTPSQCRHCACAGLPWPRHRAAA